MKSNFHMTRKAVEHRGFDKFNDKVGGAKRRSWAFDDRNDRLLTGRVKVSAEPQQVEHIPPRPVTLKPSWNDKPRKRWS